jgi:hypothetical protein
MVAGQLEALPCTGEFAGVSQMRGQQLRCTISLLPHAGQPQVVVPEPCGIQPVNYRLTNCVVKRIDAPFVDWTDNPDEFPVLQLCQRLV